ncbi:MAG: hypothetical protein FWG63_10835 [Defluviitaleaceae bacterium]|nr:hypothetical protein [Defluviitaleaceae bacterium]
MDNLKESIEEFITAGEKKQTKKWSAFIESDVLNFFNTHGIEKLAIEDGGGNKAKLSRQKNDEVKVESSSTTIY